MTQAMADGIRNRFRHSIETQKYTGDSLALGREFVEAYVVSTHYVDACTLISREKTAVTGRWLMPMVDMNIGIIIESVAHKTRTAIRLFASA